MMLRIDEVEESSQKWGRRVKKGNIKNREKESIVAEK